MRRGAGGFPAAAERAHEVDARACARAFGLDQRLPVAQARALCVDHRQVVGVAFIEARLRGPGHARGRRIGLALLGDARIEGPHRDQRILDLAEGLQHRLAVLRHALLVGAARAVELGLAASAVEQRQAQHRARERTQQEGALRPVAEVAERGRFVAERTGQRERGKVRGLRHADACVLRGHGALGGRDVGPALEQGRGQARRQLHDGGFQRLRGEREARRRLAEQDGQRVRGLRVLLRHRQVLGARREQFGPRLVDDVARHGARAELALEQRRGVLAQGHGVGQQAQLALQLTQAEVGAGDLGLHQQQHLVRQRALPRLVGPRGGDARGDAAEDVDLVGHGSLGAPQRLRAARRAVSAPRGRARAALAGRAEARVDLGEAFRLAARGQRARLLQPCHRDRHVGIRPQRFLLELHQHGVAEDAPPGRGRLVVGGFGRLPAAGFFRRRHAGRRTGLSVARGDVDAGALLGGRERACRQQEGDGCRRQQVPCGDEAAHARPSGCMGSRWRAASAGAS